MAAHHPAGGLHQAAVDEQLEALVTVLLVLALFAVVFSVIGGSGGRQPLESGLTTQSGPEFNAKPIDLKARRAQRECARQTQDAAETISSRPQYGAAQKAKQV